MEQLKIGTVVYALRGRDCGKWLCVVGNTSTHLLLCDGKERLLEKPKAKNPKHIRQTAHQLPPEALRSNRALKQALMHFSEA